MLHMVTFTINIPPMLAYIPYMDPMGNIIHHSLFHQPSEHCDMVDVTVRCGSAASNGRGSSSIGRPSQSW